MQSPIELKMKRSSISILSAVVTLSLAVVSRGEVAYQSDFTGTNLASAGLATTDGGFGTWTLDTINDRVKGSGSGNSRANLYTSNSWQNVYGFTLDVTFRWSVAPTRYSFGLVDASYPISGTGDWLNSSLSGAYGIGFSAAGSGPSDYLGFHNGSTASVLSTNQMDITIGAIQTVSITVTPDSWSYSLNGQPSSTGSNTFDTSKSYRFTAHAQQLHQQYISNITFSSIPPPGTVIRLY